MIATRLEEVSFAYFNGLVLNEISLSVADGEMVGLIGPNGSGKTTLLKLVSGILHPTMGTVHLDGLNLRHLKRKAAAQKVAMVPQQFQMPFAFRVREVVTLGRTPFLKMFSEESKGDRAIVNQAMEATGVKPLEQRLFNELSSGERQKVTLAMALAQQPRLLLLDEPTAHLDISHQVEILGLVKRLNEEQGITVISAMHDLNLASLYFKRLVLLKEGSIVADGTPAQVLTPQSILEVFSASVQVAPHPQTKVPHIVILPIGDASKPE